MTLVTLPYIVPEGGISLLRLLPQWGYGLSLVDSGVE